MDAANSLFAVTVYPCLKSCMLASMVPRKRAALLIMWLPHVGDDRVSCSERIAADQSTRVNPRSKGLRDLREKLDEQGE